VEQGVTAAAMEVSSHALALGRVAGTSYDVALFTNLSQDHLDFHETIDAYFAAKAALFTPAYARTGVVNIDDEHGRRLAAAPQIPLTRRSERELLLSSTVMFATTGAIIVGLYRMGGAWPLAMGVTPASSERTIRLTGAASWVKLAVPGPTSESNPIAPKIGTAALLFAFMADPSFRHGVRRG